jgi:hypothetical protein
MRRGGTSASARLDRLALLEPAWATYARTGVSMDDISLQQVLEVVADFDQSGGASVSLTGGTERPADTGCSGQRVDPALEPPAFAAHQLRVAESVGEQCDPHAMRDLRSGAARLIGN